MDTTTLVDNFKRPVASRIREVLEADRFSEAKWKTISFLCQNNNITVKELAAGSGLLGPSLSRVIDALEESKHIKIKGNTSDLRSVIIAVTPKGERLYNRLIDKMNKAMMVSKADIEILTSGLKMWAE